MNALPCCSLDQHFIYSSWRGGEHHFVLSWKGQRALESSFRSIKFTLKKMSEVVGGEKSLQGCREWFILIFILYERPDIPAIRCCLQNTFNLLRFPQNCLRVVCLLPQGMRLKSINKEHIRCFGGEKFPTFVQQELNLNELYFWPIQGRTDAIALRKRQTFFFRTGPADGLSLIWPCSCVRSMKPEWANKQQPPPPHPAHSTMVVIVCRFILLIKFNVLTIRFHWQTPNLWFL